jgi:hypothetical protein
MSTLGRRPGSGCNAVITCRSADAHVQRQLVDLANSHTICPDNSFNRLSNLVQMDRILVLDEGNIVEQGIHRELLQRQGLYDFWQYQGSNALRGNTSSLLGKPGAPAPEPVT